LKKLPQRNSSLARLCSIQMDRNRNTIEVIF
jgi:hypothetical protein